MLRSLWRWLVGEARPAFVYEVAVDGHRVRVEAPTFAGLMRVVEQLEAGGPLVTLPPGAALYDVPAASKGY